MARRSGRLAWFAGLLGLALIPLAAAVLTSCGPGSASILVYAAASLSEALPEVGQAYARETRVRVDFSFGSSGALADQALRGAPADLFISAGGQPMDRLEREGALAAGTRADLLTNRLVLVSGKDSSLNAESIEALLGPDVRRIAIADPALAPAGAYAREALERLGLWQRLEGKLVPAPDVRATLAYVETGNTDVGIVYQTDAPASRVRVLFMFPEGSHSPIVYPAAVLDRSLRRSEAERFLAYLKGRTAQEILVRHGFQPAAR
jgi:molybdate transport system substrate-binding protein